MMEESFDYSSYRPKIPGVTELKIGDDWRAFWIPAEELPEREQVEYAWALLYRGNWGYVIRPRESDEPWGTVETEVKEGEDPAELLERLAHERAGAKVQRMKLFGYLECRATSANQRFAPGQVTLRPAYMAIVGEMEDAADESGYERRRMNLSEHNVAIRRRYPELANRFTEAAQEYAVMVAKGEVAR